MLVKRTASALLSLLAISGSALGVEKAECLAAYESAQRNTKATKLSQARRDLLVCVDPACPELLRNDCAKWLPQVEASLPTVVFVVRDAKGEVPNVTVRADGEVLAESLTGKALAVDPGRHTFRFEPLEGKAVEREITVREGEKNRTIDITLGDAPTDDTAPSESPTPTAAYVLAGVGAVGLVSFTYFGISGLSRRSDLGDCKGSCSEDDVDGARADFTRADISLAIAALALGGAAYFYFSKDDGKSERPHAYLKPHAAGVSAGLGFGF